ncbi:hypothetical protein ABH933_001282 [Nocardia sp. GP40]|uniref:cutinase family protein n=1 Tax=Nocardia sp. GP40 TaxID=3156268 RepID=UPI003D1F4EDF
MKLVRAAAGVLAAAVLAAGAPVAVADAGAGQRCPDIHVLAVQGTAEPSVPAPTGQDTGELAGVIIPVVNAARPDGFTMDRTYIPYPAAPAGQQLEAAYKTSVLDGFQRLSQVAARVIYQCPSTKLVVLGYSEGAEPVSLWAQQVAAGKTEGVSADDVALTVTFGDPTRGDTAPLFAGKPGQLAPAAWPGLDQGKRPSVTKFPDMYVPPTGEGIGPERDIATSFGPLDGRVAQWCLGGDLSCSAPKSISLARAGLGIAAQSSLDFTHDPFGVVGELASATANTLINGASTFADKDIQGSNLADVEFARGASISQRLAEAADPTNTAPPTDPLQAVLKLGQIALTSVTSFLGQVLNPAVLGSLATAGVQIATSAVGAAIPALVGGPAAALAAGAAGAAAGAAAAAPSLVLPAITLGASAVNAAMTILPPQSAVQRVSSIFGLLTTEVQKNADLPALLMDSRLWTQVSDGGYRTVRVAADGSTPADVTADWIIAAGRDYHAANQNASAAKNPDAPAPDAPYQRTPDGAIATPVQDRPDLGAVSKNDTHGDVRLFDAPPAPGTTTPAPVVWLPVGAASIADRLVTAAAGTGPAAAMLRSGSPVLVATTATTRT